MAVAAVARPRLRRAKTAAAPPEAACPPPEILERMHRFSVSQFQRMIAVGVFPSGVRVELLKGWIYQKMTQNPPHAVVLQLAQEVLRPLLPSGWHLREQKPIVTSDSHPEPDITVARGRAQRYIRQHPRPADIGLLVEVSDSSLDEDRELKAVCYAEAKIPVYWIINVAELKVEVYTHPRRGRTPGYRQRRDYGLEDSIPLVLDGKEVARVPVRELFVLPGDEE